jgi:hypothetical protein
MKKIPTSEDTVWYSITEELTKNWVWEEMLSYTRSSIDADDCNNAEIFICGRVWDAIDTTFTLNVIRIPLINIVENINETTNTLNA